MSIPFQRDISTFEPFETEDTRAPMKPDFGAIARLLTAVA